MSADGVGASEDFSIPEPTLTTSSVFTGRLGFELAHMLLKKLQQPGTLVPSRTFPCKLVEGGSCAPPNEP